MLGPALLAAALAAGAAGALPLPRIDVLPALRTADAGLLPSQLAVVINDADAQSRTVGAGYQALRGVPAANMVHLNFSTKDVLPAAEFAVVKAQLDAALGAGIQALALTWTWPYRVGCMSVTSAFALGFDVKYCSTPCATTAAVPYYNSSSSAPFTDFGIRPAMLLAGWTAAAALGTAAAGVAADGTHPLGDGYLVRTPDAARSVRFPEFQAAVAAMAGELNNSYLDCSAAGSCGGAPYIAHATGVLAYFQSLASVPQLATVSFVPGAMGDHLTSYGGILTNSSGQMPCTAFLAAGATGSYGTVVEPCNYVGKFPDPSILLPAYYAGGSLLEAYWKSVQMPGEGLFVGEPLASPYRKSGELASPLAAAAAVQRGSHGEGGSARVQLSNDGMRLGIVVTLPPSSGRSSQQHQQYELWACTPDSEAASGAACGASDDAAGSYAGSCCERVLAEVHASTRPTDSEPLGREPQGHVQLRARPVWIRMEVLLRSAGEHAPMYQVRRAAPPPPRSQLGLHVPEFALATWEREQASRLADYQAVPLS